MRKQYIEGGRVPRKGACQERGGGVFEGRVDASMHTISIEILILG